MADDAIREALEVVRKGCPTNPKLWEVYVDSCELLARWLVEQAGELAVGDEHIRARLATALEPLLPTEAHHADN